MWAAKLPGEGYALYETCSAMCKIMAALGIAVDGGKDSLSMAAKVDSEVVKSPGSYINIIGRTSYKQVEHPLNCNAHYTKAI